MPIIGIIASANWASANASSFDSIASATGTGSSTTITFSNISADYKHLQLRVTGKTTPTAVADIQNIYIRFNNDSTAANYAWHQLQGNGTSASATGATGAGRCEIRNAAVTSESTLANMLGVSIIDIHDYASTTKNKTIRSFSGASTNMGSTTWRLSLASGLWINTAAVNRIDIIGDSNFTTSSTFALYGIKG